MYICFLYTSLRQKSCPPIYSFQIFIFIFIILFSISHVSHVVRSLLVVSFIHLNTPSSMVYSRLSNKSSKQLRQQQQLVTSPLDAPQFDLEEIDSHWPPVEDFSNETPTQREERLEREREAKRINDEIDAQIEIEKSERRKRQADIRVILLGPPLLSPMSIISQRRFSFFFW